jgi:hypothetical protein
MMAEKASVTDLQEAWSSKRVYLSLTPGHSMVQTLDYRYNEGIYVHSWHRLDVRRRILSCELKDPSSVHV